MHGCSRKWFPKNKYTSTCSMDETEPSSSTTSRLPMEEKKAIYRRPKGRLFHGGSDNSWRKRDSYCRKQSDHLIASRVSRDPSSPKPDLGETSPRLENLGLVDVDCSSGMFRTPSYISNSKVEISSSNAKGERSSSNPIDSSSTAPHCAMDDKKAIYKPPKGQLIQAGSENRWKTMHCSVGMQSDPVMVSNISYDPSARTPDSTDLTPRLGNLGLVDDDCHKGLFQSPSYSSSSEETFRSSSDKYRIDDRHTSSRLNEYRVDTFGKSGRIVESFEPTDSDIKQGKASQSRIDSSGKLDDSQIMVEDAPYSICCAKNPNVIKLKAPLLLKNREKRKEMNRGVERQNVNILRPGMVYLRHYLSVADQVKIVEACCKLGMGPAGFYQPGYHDGAKLNLKMMCLGKNWDPQTSAYSMERSTDGAKPPSIPDEFCKLVERAMQESDSYSRKNAGEILPSITPDVCIVNFYTQSGRLGLHQDKDESKESLRRALPVVSFSIGDSAEFLYGDQRDVDTAEKLILESGDVLIFGGSSRHIFHGVKNINGGTAPKHLLEESNLRPGRLNLTFRQY